MEASFSQAAATALVNISLAWTVGVLASKFWLIKGVAQWQKPVRSRLSFAMAASLFACAISIVLSLWTEAAVMGDVAWLDAGPAFSEMLASTHYGHAGLAAIATLVLALFAQWRRKRQSAEIRGIGIIAVLVLLVALARVSIGHASENGLFSVAALVEWLHVLLMSLWAGAVFVAGWMVLPHMLANESLPTEEKAVYLTSLSNWATVALAGILTTGAYNAYRVLGSPRDLVEGDYGHVLVFKLCFVVVAIVLGGFNRFYGLPAALTSNAPAKAQRGLRTVVAILRIESGALLLVIVAAAVLTSSAPPG